FSAYYVVAGTGRRYFANRAHGALGYAMAASMGAHLAKPAVKTVAVMGDGSFGMCVGELETALRLHLPITFFFISKRSTAGSRQGRSRAMTGATSRSISASPTTPRSPMHSA